MKIAANELIAKKIKIILFYVILWKYDARSGHSN